MTEMNEGYEERLSRLVAFNGERVRNLAHLEVGADFVRLCVIDNCVSMCACVCVHAERTPKP